MSRRKPIGRLHSAGRRLLRLRWRHVAAALCLASACLVVRYVPLRKWQGWIRSNDGAPVSAEQSEMASRLGRCVERVAAHLPFRAVCLPQALAARWMIERCGIPTVLTLGIRPAPDPAQRKRVDLHAWLMVGELCVIGGADRFTFTIFRPPRS